MNRLSYKLIDKCIDVMCLNGLIDKWMDNGYTENGSNENRFIDIHNDGWMDWQIDSSLTGQKVDRNMGRQMVDRQMR